MATSGLSSRLVRDDVGWKGAFVLAVAWALYLLFTAGRVLSYEPTPWLLVVAFTVGAVVLFGPLRWAIGAVFAESTRESAKSYGVSTLLLAAPVGVPAVLLLGAITMQYFSLEVGSTDTQLVGDTLTVGILTAIGIVVGLEFAGIQDRVRGLDQ